MLKHHDSYIRIDRKIEIVLTSGIDCFTILLWFFNTWRPSLTFSYTSLRGMFAFGSRFLASGLLDTIFSNKTKYIV